MINAIEGVYHIDYYKAKSRHCIWYCQSWLYGVLKAFSQDARRCLGVLIHSENPTLCSGLIYRRLKDIAITFLTPASLSLSLHHICNRRFKHFKSYRTETKTAYWLCAVFKPLHVIDYKHASNYKIRLWRNHIFWTWLGLNLQN